ncbi:MAG: ATP-binding cassette domain-containing protein, partial [Peptostreptococcaceae bacterium]
NKDKNHKEAKELLKVFNIEIDTKTKIENLSVNTKQFIEIAREVDKKNLKILLLDEPTACLNKYDTEIFKNIINILKQKGVSIIFISHRLDEITNLCDKVAVFKDGEMVSKYEKKEFDIEKIAIDMIGKKVSKSKKSDEDRTIDYKNTKKILEFDNISIQNGNKQMKNINIDIYKGEILGITSLAGHGYTMLSNLIMGMYKCNGNILYKNSKININTPHKTIQSGIVMIPDERKEMGVLLEASIKNNIIFTACYSKNKFLKYPKLKGLSFLNKFKANDYVDKCIDEFNIKCSSKNQYVRELSGGNQQKICIARALSTNPEILFIGEPTRGIDIYSKEIILNLLLEANKNNNTTIVIASSEIEELKRVCDRIIVMYEGQVFTELSPTEEDEVFSLAISGRRR